MEFLASDLEQYSHVAAELEAKLNNIIESSKCLQHRMLPVNRNVTHLQTRRQSESQIRSARRLGVTTGLAFPLPLIQAGGKDKC